MKRLRQIRLESRAGDRRIDRGNHDDLDVGVGCFMVFVDLSDRL